MATVVRYPSLKTDRLVLRGFIPEDAPRVQALAGNRAVAATTALIPHPYPDGEAERWIETHNKEYGEGRSVTFAVTLRGSGELIGACSLTLCGRHKRAEIGFWIGEPYWGFGYATEAARAVIAFGFARGLNRIFAEHYHVNPASGRVLQKAGMTHEGTNRQHMIKWGKPMDCEVYGILASEWKCGS
ncbi:MAG TPA: GNAT family N-acetyltransferase [candidate division Zixibacteria bacterium]|jgi:RimJ/RimL family protein N-acetyltransferase